MKAAFEIKSARTDALAVHLDSADAAAVGAALDKCAAQYRELNLPLILDMQAFRPAAVDLPALLAVFRSRRLPVAALRHSDETWAKIAAVNGVAFSPAGRHAPTDTADAPAPAPQASARETAPAKPAGHPTVFVAEPVRTGQQVYAENADLIVTGMVSEGAELIADGNIHIYAPMRGRALAGAKGRRDARIFIHSMQAELVSIAGIYRNFEQKLPAHLDRHPVQIYLHEDRLVIAAIDA
ncbi:septum site-determining protein MinC [Neisseria sp. oral taxon 020 str. F0370]|uniref:septum site-determining protein MinC n=1 Tax=unclassified Neisseria TaxID=2623750 RepID=UPI0002A3CEE3|nr:MULTISPECIES: septum site-determining protein MinC [unclassified Neisseria]ASP16477.1 septum site-determining protein MinC [Neisseria sp. KEM232]EKY05517.1 septum site-determining protein MinC [Neisseria sp. oral taxon 020 str. F0370]